MEIKAKLSNLRTAPRKVRLVIDLIRGKRVPEAQSILLFTVNKSARSVLKLLNSAVASAKQNHQLNEEDLFISKITADEGPKMKRFFPMSRGRAYPIIKRSCHIAISLSEINPVKEVKSEVKIEKVETKKEKPEVKETKKAVKTVKKEVKSRVKKSIKK